MTKTIVNEVINLLENRKIALSHPLQPLSSQFENSSNVE
jgi:hypothetical protein